MALESQKYHHSTQNQKLHRTVSLDFFRKNLTFPLCFHFIINLNLKKVLYKYNLKKVDINIKYGILYTVMTLYRINLYF